jgi:fatty acid desaturase
MPEKLSQNPRETMRDLPKWMQPFLTMATGKPLEVQNPWNLTPSYHLTTASLSLIAGVITNLVSLHYCGISPFLIIGWLFTVSGARKLQVMILHQCAHQQFSGKEKLDQWLGET